MAGQLRQTGTRQTGTRPMFSIAAGGSSSCAQTGQTGQQQCGTYTHPGLVAGSVILTADGAIPVEYLCPGDRIITRNAGLARISAVHCVQYAGDFIQIAARALGATRPDSDTILPAAQTILLRGQAALALTGQASALVPAQALARLPGVTPHDGIEMTLVQLVFDAPQLVYADGLETLCLPDARASLAA